MEGAALAPPGPDRALEVRGIDYDAEEAVLASWIVSGANLQRHLVVGPKVDRLHVAACAQVPEVNAMAIPVAKQIFGYDAVLELRRQRPLASDHIVPWQVPPKIVVELLRTSID